jgi:hypothetical protein
VNRRKIAGMSLGGGRKDKFFFCFIEYFVESDRWSLTSLRQVKDESEMDGDEAIPVWTQELALEDLVVDFPLTQAPCHECLPECPGMTSCPRPEVESVCKAMASYIEDDRSSYEEHPKTYEKKRVALETSPEDKLLSRAFKRKMKKGFVPYWNRLLDFWVWQNYYDQLLEFFNLSYDSFGQTSLMLMARFRYLKRHFPLNLRLWESDTHLCLIELYRAKIIPLNLMKEFNDLEKGAFVRAQILKILEEKLKFFIYEHDFQLMAKNPQAFDSFLLAIAGQRHILDKKKKSGQEKFLEDQFIVPTF